jgi:hypothetical protein
VRLGGGKVDALASKNEFDEILRQPAPKEVTLIRMAGK